MIVDKIFISAIVGNGILTLLGVCRRTGILFLITNNSRILSQNLIKQKNSSCDINYNPNSSPKAYFHQRLEKDKETKKDYSIGIISARVVIVCKESKTKRDERAHRLIEPVICIYQTKQ